MASAVVAMLSWYPAGHSGFSLLVVATWAMCRTRLQLFFAAFAYYGTAMTDLLEAPAVFFPGIGAVIGCVLGLLAWMVWVSMLAALQTLPFDGRSRNRGLNVLLGLILTTVPPFGWFGVVSPLNSLGYWFPGSGWWGLLLGAGVVMFTSTLARNVIEGRMKGWSLGAVKPVFMLVMIAALSAWLNARYVQPIPVEGWSALGTKFGTHDESMVEDFRRSEHLNQVIGDIVSAAGSDRMTTDDQMKQVAVFPELAAGRWSPRTQYWLRPAIKSVQDNPDLAWISGAVQDHESGVLVANKDGVKFLTGRIPMPFAMWRPGQFEVHPWQVPVVDVAGKRATISICYESSLPWAQWQSYWKKPDIHLSLESLWFSSGMNAANIQSRTVEGWARMFGVPLLRAVNY